MPIPFGIIGTNWITTSYIHSAQSTNHWTLRAVYSRTEAAAKDFAAKHDNGSKINIHTSIDSLASDPDIQAVYIASPNSLHYEQTKVILQAKKHVILEKPATSTLKELDELFALAKEHGVFVIEAYRHVHEPNFKILKQSLSKLGRITGASLNFCQYSSRYDAVLAGETPNVFSLDFSGGALVDLGVYPVSAAIDLFGAPKSSTYAPVKIATGADGGGNVLMRYENFSVAVNFSKIYDSTAPSEVYGDNGTLVIPSVTDITSVKFLDRKRKGEAEELGGKGVEKELNLVDEARLFAGWIEGGDEGAVGEWGEFSRSVVRVTQGLRWAEGLVFGVERGKEALTM